jgi:hypothetical protein
MRWIRERCVGDPGIGTSEFEDTAVEIRADGDGYQLKIRYVFDYDGFSQYDKTETFEGAAFLDGETLEITSGSMVSVKRGEGL